MTPSRTGFGRPGVSGKWVDAFGTVTVTPADGGAYRLAIETRAVYGSGEDRRRECKVGAVVKPGAGGWLSGELLPDEDKPASKAEGKAEPAKPPTIRLRRQGETLRVVLADAEWRDEDHPNCAYMWQVTASYFAAGRPNTATDKADTAFVAPTFDCARLETATEEEICADPDLAANDQRLNRAWKALLPRLDETTRRALTEDQRKWVGSQAAQYPEFLHPAWEKRTSFMHFTSDARDKLDRLQRERIALLDGFDDKRSGLAGTWLAYNAVIQVNVGKGRQPERQGLEVGPGRLEGRLRLRDVGQTCRRLIPFRRGPQEPGYARARPRHADRQPPRRCLCQEALEKGRHRGRDGRRGQMQTQFVELIDRATVPRPLLPGYRQSRRRFDPIAAQDSSEARGTSST